MDNTTSLRIELNISAQKISQMVMINNEGIEQQISKGIEMAINDLMDGDNFIEKVREATKQELALIVNKSVMSWEVKNSISKMISEKVNEKIEAYADQLASVITSNLKM